MQHFEFFLFFPLPPRRTGLKSLSVLQLLFLKFGSAALQILSIFFLTSQMNRFEISKRLKAAFAPFNVLTQRLFVLSISCLSCFFRKVLLKNRNACFGSTLGPLTKSRNSPVNAFFQTGAIKSKTLKKKTAPESPFSQCCTLPACNFLERDTVICFNEFCKIVTNNLSMQSTCGGYFWKWNNSFTSINAELIPSKKHLFYLLHRKLFKNDEKYHLFHLNILLMQKKQLDQKNKVNFKIYGVTICLTKKYQISNEVKATRQ